MDRVSKGLRDLLGLGKVCGWKVAMRWFGAVILNFPAILKTGNLQPADRHLGEGPFAVNHPAVSSSFLICGPEAISGIREMYVRDTYLRGGALTIEDGDVVVDLGANAGNFTNLALAHGPSVRVVAVEPSTRFNALFEESVQLNCWRDRVTLVNTFLGTPCVKQNALIQIEEYQESGFMSESEFLMELKIDRVDFLKCDIEGGEFGFFTPESKLLAMTHKIAIEIHHFAGNVEQFRSMLIQLGFCTVALQMDPDGTCTVLAKS